MTGIATALIALLAGESARPAPKFYRDDPISVDRDDLSIEKPGIVELSSTYDLLENTFARPALPLDIPRAMNVNTLGEVPDSSWFVNRIGIRDIEPEELLRGPGNGPPPVPPLTVIAGNPAGPAPGFRVRDSEGRIFSVKLDPLEHPNLSTAAEVIGKNFFHAIGYNVTDSFIVYLRGDDLTIEEGLDRDFLAGMIDRAAHHQDGTLRVVASPAFEGEPLGPFKFHGTRPDDPNDVILHEDRRELRGYRVFCAWLNQEESGAMNTLDTFILREDGGGWVRHHLIDFSSILGSGSDPLGRIAPQDSRAGNEYLVDKEPTLKAAYTFGIADRHWREVPYAYPQYAEAGRIEADFFDPSRWKPQYPNPAFDRMLADDGFWAAKIVARFSDEAIRRIVATGDFLSKDAERYLAEMVMRRRDKIVEYYFRQLNPLDGFVVKGSLLFRNLGAERALAPVEAYEFQWFAFDNLTRERASLGGPGRAIATRIPLPATEGEYRVVRIRTLSAAEPRWSKAVEVYLRGAVVVGIDREI